MECTGPRSAVGNVSVYRCVSGVASLIPARSHTFVEIDHECTLPGTTNVDKGFRVCLLLNYFLKRFTWLAVIS